MLTPIDHTRSVETNIGTRYALLGFLQGRVTPEHYEHWLRRKADAHVRRDRGRGIECTREDFRLRIHEAVQDSGGLDAYTGQDLDWELLSEYDNESSREGRTEYKRKFARLPTVDHSIAGDAKKFMICAWRTNDAKNDMELEDFRNLCVAVLLHAGYTVTEQNGNGSVGSPNGGKS